MERQFGPFKTGDLVKFRHQDEPNSIGVVVSTIEYPDSHSHSFCWVVWNFLNGKRGRNLWTMLERVQ